ncbi:MAG: hypothetical protein O7G86_05420 [Gammaproteobacteria bacterium]|nr:hypothetical protein [Gammaproteobacteria bacterium]
MDKIRILLSLLLLTVVTVSKPSLAATDPACPFGSTLPPTDILIGYIGNIRRTNQGGGWVELGSFRVLGIVRDGRLVASDGAAISEGMNYWNVLEPSAAPTSLQQVSSFLDLSGINHCVFHAEPKQNLPLWTLLSDRPLPGVFHHPNPSETTYFAEQHDVCVDQGDPEPREKPPCSRPKLLAVSELNQEGEKQYWATEPYRWDTGITVWKRTENGLSSIIKVCSGCSD